MKSLIGSTQITEKQAEKLSLKKSKRLSPALEKSCLRLVANESFERAEEDIERLTGMRVPRSTQHRLVEDYPSQATETKETIKTLSIDGGKVRIRTLKGQASRWQDYKVVSLHEDICAGFFQENKELIAWINRQPQAEKLVCLGDGHPGIWKLISEIGKKAQRREILDWYHLKENLYKIGGSIQFLKEIENYLWPGKISSVRQSIGSSNRKEVVNFGAYIERHRERIPNYENSQKCACELESNSSSHAHQV